MINADDNPATIRIRFDFYKSLNLIKLITRSPGFFDGRVNNLTGTPSESAHNLQSLLHYQEEGERRQARRVDDVAEFAAAEAAQKTTKSWQETAPVFVAANRRSKTKLIRQRMHLLLSDPQIPHRHRRTAVVEGHADQFDGLAGIVHGPAAGLAHAVGAQLQADAAALAHLLEHPGHHGA